MNYFSDKTASPLKLKISKTEIFTFNLIAMMIVFMSDNMHEICIIIDQNQDKKIMKEGSEFYLSDPQFIATISNINVYRKTSKTLLKLSISKKKIKSAKRFEADRITEVMSNLPETLKNENISSEESPSTADVGSPSTSTADTASLYDWLRNPSIQSDSVQMIIIESKVDVIRMS